MVRDWHPGVPVGNDVHQQSDTVNPGTRENPTREHLLLTVLGKDPTPARYTLGEREIESRLAPLALFELLPEEDRPDRMLALCTPEAKQDSWPLLEDALDARCPIEAAEVPSGDGQSDNHVLGEPSFERRQDKACRVPARPTKGMPCRDALLQEHGYLVPRFLAEDLGTGLDAVLDEVLRALASRRPSS